MIQFLEGLNGFEAIPGFLNNAAFWLVPHSGSSLCVCSVLNIGQCLCVQAILTPNKRRLVSRMTLWLRPVVHKSIEVSSPYWILTSGEGTELPVIIFR